MISKSNKIDWFVFWVLLGVYLYFTTWSYCEVLFLHCKAQLQTLRENSILLPQENGMLTVIYVKIPKIIGNIGEKRILRIVTPTKTTGCYKLPDIPLGRKTYTKVFIDEKRRKVLLEDANKGESLRYCLDFDSSRVWYIVNFREKVYWVDISKLMTEQEARQYLKNPAAYCILPRIYTYTKQIDNYNRSVIGLVIHGKEPDDITLDWAQLKWTYVGVVN